ncbi:MAG TPA: aminotransferase class IV [Cryomorphaceae bacterium]|nr:aminotransferase class IV [Owenweeksia sp.]MBF98869.1 aminotransferase class IV [Owenweeksia sp.]HAD97664.1 aminotransferase class IV [Cryomorphaceae bacterium]HBF20610.1 aminotransferase class IV [Cryomorphaceae bacterium]HCQ16662.1 aminotransferase class IV [Cryomorphaceae bacterium]|tara:strand:- start:14 stop:865 length:852 start_codon:yes stop_codon:yes gene_type:complete
MNNTTYNWNGELIHSDTLKIGLDNRGLNYGDGVFETLKYANGRINFWEDHYFRLMSSMRIMRMEIPMSFSAEYLEEQLLQTVQENKLDTARIKLLILRKPGGLYTPQLNDVDYLVTASSLEQARFVLNEEGLTIDMYKDFYKPKNLLSNLKGASAQLYTLASVFRKENGLDECLLLNDQKYLTETISSNIFLVKGKEVITPSLKSGCLKGIIRKQVLEILSKMDYAAVEQENISPFELQKVDEVFLTNTIQGIRWVKRYRKKEFGCKLSAELTEKLNVKAALG